MTDKHYEEPEIVNLDEPKRYSAASNDDIEDVFRDFAQNGVGDIQKKLLRTAFWPVVTGLFVLFVVIALVISLLFWLLPFAVAAIVVGVLVFGGFSFIQGIVGFFKK